MNKEIATKPYKSKYVSHADYFYRNTLAVKVGLKIVSFGQFVFNKFFSTNAKIYMSLGAIFAASVLSAWLLTETIGTIVFFGSVTILVILAAVVEASGWMVHNKTTLSYVTPNTRAVSAMFELENNKFFDTLVENLDDLPRKLNLVNLYHLWVSASKAGGEIEAEVKNAIRSIGDILPKTDAQADEINELVSNLQKDVTSYRKAHRDVNRQIDGSVDVIDREDVIERLKNASKKVREESEIMNAVAEESRQLYS